MYFLDFKILQQLRLSKKHMILFRSYFCLFLLYFFSKMPIAIFDDSYYRAWTTKRNETQARKDYSKILLFHFFKISKFIPFLIKLRPISNQIMYVPFLIKLRCMHLNWYNLLSRVESCKKIMQVRDLRSDLHFLRIFQERCIKAGTLTVNYEKVDIDYRLKHNDLLANIVHR